MHRHLKPRSSEPKRLGIFISTDAYGGAERYIGLLADAFEELPLEVIVIGNLPGPPSRANKNVTVSVGPKWSRRTAIRSAFSFYQERRAYLAAASVRRLDGAHLQFKREQIMLSKQLSATMPVIWTEHGTLPRGPYGAVLRKFYGRSSRYASVIICVSQAVADDLLSCGIPARKLRVAENPVDVEEFRPDKARRLIARQELKLGTDDVAVLAMSRLDRHKGIHRLISAMHDLPPNYVLIVAGRGDAEEELRQLAAPLGNRVRFVGFQDEPARLLSAADVFCFASTAASGEGVPTMAVLEAMATALPVVATHDSGLGDWLPQRGGLVAGDVAPSLASTIDTAFNRRSGLGTAARETAQGHDLAGWRFRESSYFMEVLYGQDTDLTSHDE